MSRSIRTLLAALSAAAVLLSAAPAGAAEVRDPNDVPGKLDLKRLVGRRNAEGILRIRIETWGNWKKSLLNAKTTRNRLFVLFNVDEDPKPEYVGKIMASKGKLFMTIRGSGSVFEPLPVRKPAGNAVTTIVPGNSPPNPEGPLRLAARSRYVSDFGKCTEGCVDRAPNGGWLGVA